MNTVKIGSPSLFNLNCWEGDEIIMTVQEYQELVKRYHNGDKAAGTTLFKEQVPQQVEIITTRIMQTNGDRIRAVLIKYLPVLVIKKDQLLYKDEFGDIIYDDWYRYLDGFIETKIPVMSQKLCELAKSLYLSTNIGKVVPWYDSDTVGFSAPFIRFLIESFIDEHKMKSLKENGSFTTANIATDGPLEYERTVCMILESLGWTAHLTRASGDQGADVIGSKNGNRLIIQCKLYSRPVGNDAVQQVIAARTFYNGAWAAVVSNQDFTKSARQLASSSNVLLLHHNNLEDALNLLEA